jgi:hypothetical protein
LEPEKIQKIFPKNSFYNNKFGTISIVEGDDIFEVTTFRTTAVGAAAANQLVAAVAPGNNLVVGRASGGDNIEFECKYNKINNLDIEIFNDKKKYVLDRMFNTVDDINKIPNIIFDIKKFIEQNNIQLIEESKNMLDLLNKSFVGFLSNRGSLITCRNIDKENSFRYFNLHLGKDLFFKDFYGILNIKKYDSINTVIYAEGIFDILRIYFNENLNNYKNESCIYAATLGNKYNELILSTLDYCRISKANIVIFSDKDVKNLRTLASIDIITNTFEIKKRNRIFW